MRKKPSAKARLQRRHLLTSAGKVIPALAMLGLSLVASAPARATNCMAGCVGDCTGTCGGKCADSCVATCATNCTGTCLGGCAGQARIL
ncbi:MAG: Cys-Xaa-Xaa-Xaa repeat radical SAM target protein [Rhodospirillales bacterium]|nr:Cys-Xaa-Xaa-Xaa repeat radical SAM target protein [Rhodospirillales bacterium]